MHLAKLFFSGLTLVVAASAFALPQPGARVQWRRDGDPANVAAGDTTTTPDPSTETSTSTTDGSNASDPATTTAADLTTSTDTAMTSTPTPTMSGENHNATADNSTEVPSNATSDAADLVAPIKLDMYTVSAPKNSVPNGLVTTKGTYFVMNGKPWTFAGTNVYALFNKTSEDEIRNIVKEVADAGYLAIRTWAFNEYLNGSDPEPYVYFQVWNNGTPSINAGANGLQKLDQLVRAAEEYNVKLVLALTNNWHDGFGAMDTYVAAASNVTKHSLFYTDPKIVNYYKDYVGAVVRRYSHSSAILAWELANEARCGGNVNDTVANAPPYLCTADTITHWADEISSHIKSVDSSHMVAFGGEGFFNWKNRTTYEYNGGSGQDFDALLNLTNIDFGTVHAYPNGNVPWADRFINDHTDPALKANKPLVLEEYGYSKAETSPSRQEVYGRWHFFELSNKVFHGDMPWLFADKNSPPDNYTLDPRDKDYTDLVTNFTKQMNDKAKKLVLPT